MKILSKAVTVLLICVLLNACFLSSNRRDGKFMTEVVNLAEFNSEWDDYNSDLPMNKYGDTRLTFSSKRDKRDYYNLVSFSAKIDYNDKTDIPVLSKSNNGNLDSFTENLFVDTYASLANGDFNVLGPYSVSRDNIVSYGSSPKYRFLFYADDKEKNLDIKVIYADKDGKTIGPTKVDYLNSVADDAYPTISYRGDKIFFCSNRAGQFDIFQTTIGNPVDSYTTSVIDQLISPANPVTERVNTLSAANADDKCPYLWNEYLLVFTSDRPGGFGGYDIYYAVWENGGFSAPVNAGPRINTAYDEYRPILPVLRNFGYPLMIFSSNRPGGKGGFDLYMTGLAEMDNMGKVKQ